MIRRAALLGVCLLSACGGTTALKPSISVPFSLRGKAGVVELYYGVNRDPRRWGFERLRLPFDIATTIGFPVFQGMVRYPAQGYWAFMGWIQLVAVRDPLTGEEKTTVDQIPFWRKFDSPFMQFGPSPMTFDAPGPNPPRTQAVWTAHTFLVFCPDVARTRRVAPLLAVRWGYNLFDGKATPLPLEVESLEAWDRVAPILRGDFPGWEFLPAGTPSD